MKILTLSCIHNDIENLMILFDQIKKIDFDIIVFPGDFTDLNFPKGFERIDIARIIVAEFMDLDKPILSVPGSWDKELIEYLDKEKISVHNKGVKIDDFGFYGYGGARTPFGTPFEPTDSEIVNGLKKGYEMIKDQKFKIQVTHMPPARTVIDRLYNGSHVGSEGIRDFIQEFKPNVAISSHIHEAKGFDDIGNSMLINPGRFPEGNAGFI